MRVRLSRGSDALGGEAEVEQRRILAPGGVFDGTADEARARRELDGLGGISGRVTEPFLEIRRTPAMKLLHR